MKFPRALGANVCMVERSSKMGVLGSISASYLREHATGIMDIDVAAPMFLATPAVLERIHSDSA